MGFRGGNPGEKKFVPESIISLDTLILGARLCGVVEDSNRYEVENALNRRFPTARRRTPMKSFFPLAPGFHLVSRSSMNHPNLPLKEGVIT